ncbi:unnamed protein product [Phytomonas sp. Hart1]|nr:unnamed protein product [Phytomonas sp. Hart1]|eukprot:CCW69288.1 unnamed protein product [Phytomonas sp. isolate Hart1]
MLKRHTDDCFDKSFIILFMWTVCFRVALTIVVNLILAFFPACSSALLSWAHAVWLQPLLGVVIPVKNEKWIPTLALRLLPSSLIVALGGLYRCSILRVSSNTYKNKKQELVVRNNTSSFFTHQLLHTLWLCSFVITALFLPSCLSALLLIATPLALIKQTLPGLLESNHYQPSKELYLNIQLYYLQCALVFVLIVIGVSENDEVFWMLQKLLGDSNISFIGLFRVSKTGGGILWWHIAHFLGMIVCAWFTEALIAKRHSYTCEVQEILLQNAPHLAASDETHDGSQPPLSSFILLFKSLVWRAQLFVGCSVCNTAFFPSLPSVSLVFISFFSSQGLGLTTEKGTSSSVFTALHVTTIFTASVMVLIQYILNAATRSLLFPIDHWVVKIFISDANNKALCVMQFTINVMLLVWLVVLSHRSTKPLSNPTPAALHATKDTEPVSSEPDVGFAPDHPDDLLVRSPTASCSSVATLPPEPRAPRLRHPPHKGAPSRPTPVWKASLPSIARLLGLGGLLGLVVYHSLQQGGLDLLHGALLWTVLGLGRGGEGGDSLDGPVPLFCVNAVTGVVLLSQILPSLEDPNACVGSTALRFTTLGLRRLTSRWEALPYLTSGLLLRALGRPTPGHPNWAKWTPWGGPWILVGMGLSMWMKLYAPRGVFHHLAFLLNLGVGIAFAMVQKDAARWVIRLATIHAVVACGMTTIASTLQLREVVIGVVMRNLPDCQTEELARGCVRELLGFPATPVVNDAEEGVGLALGILHWGILLLLLRLKIAPACESLNEDDRNEDYESAWVLNFLTPDEERFPHAQPWSISFFFENALHPNGGLRVLALVSIVLGQAALGIAALRHPSLLNAGYGIFLLMDGLSSPFLPLYMGLHASLWGIYQLRWVPTITTIIPGLFTWGEGVRLETFLGLWKLSGSPPWGPTEEVWIFFFLALGMMLYHATWPFLPSHFLHYYQDSYYTPRWWGFLSVQLLPSLGFELLALVLLLALHLTISSGLAIGFAVGVGLICVAGRSRLARRPSWLCALRLLLTLTFLWMAAVRFGQAIQTKREATREDSRVRWEEWGWGNCGGGGAALSCWACVVALLNYRRVVPIVEHRLNLDAMHHGGHDNLFDLLQVQRVRDLFRLPREEFERIVPDFLYQASCVSRLMKPIISTFDSLYPLLICSCVLVITSTSLLTIAVTLGTLLYVWNLQSIHLSLFMNWRKIAPLSGLPLLISLLSNVPGVKMWWAAHTPHLGVLLGFLERSPDAIRPVSFAISHVILLFCVILQTKVYNEYQYSSILRKLHADAWSRSEKCKPPKESPNSIPININKKRN